MCRGEGRLLVLGREGLQEMEHRDGIIVCHKASCAG